MLPYISIPFELAGEATGAAPDDLKLLFSFLISYPLAALLKRFPHNQPWLKNVYIISVSMFFLVGLFDLWSGLRTLAISAGGAYLIATYVQGPMMPWIGFLFLIGHMSVNHIHRQILNDPTQVDITGAQMVLVMKLSAFCWNVYDGSLDQQTLTKYQQGRAITELPGLLDYVGYVLFFPALFAGPAFDYVDYVRYLNTSMFELPKNLDPSKAPRTRNGRIPRSGRPATIKALTGLFWIGAYLSLSSVFSSELLLGDRFLQFGFLRRLLVLHLFGFTARLKYYGVWTLTEGACIISGLGYNEVDGNGKVSWNRLQNVQPLKIETAQTIRTYLDGWNINTNKWLKNYIYLRVTPKGKKAGFRATMATFLTSAIWHGFYPGYYLAFIFAGFLRTVSGAARRYLRPFFFEPFDPKKAAANATYVPKPTQYKIYYDLFSWFVTQMAMSFTVVPFLLLSLNTSLEVWRRVSYYCVFAVLACMVFIKSPLMVKVKHMVAIRTGEAYRKGEEEKKKLLLAASSKGQLTTPASAKSSSFKNAAGAAALDSGISTSISSPLSSMGINTSHLSPADQVRRPPSSVSSPSGQQRPLQPGAPGAEAGKDVVPTNYLSSYPPSDNLEPNEPEVPDVIMGVPSQGDLERAVQELIKEGKRRGTGEGATADGAGGRRGSGGVVSDVMADDIRAVTAAIRATRFKVPNSEAR